MLQVILNLIDFLVKRNSAFLKGEPPARRGVGQLQHQRTNSRECHRKTMKTDAVIVDSGQKPGYRASGLFIRPIS